MNRNIRDVVAASRTPKDPKEAEWLEKALQFVNKFTYVAPKHSSVESVLQELGYFGGDVDSETSSFSFAIADGLGVSFAPSRSGSTGAAPQQRNALGSFASDLAHRCATQNNTVQNGGGSVTPRKASVAADEKDDDEDKLSFSPWIGLATIMFVDLSGYSKIASALMSQGGAHALSSAVNSYFEAILDIVVGKFCGDIVTFAGDAICICWPCADRRTPQDSALLACSCALELQKKCGMSPVQGTDLSFRLHIGITYGEIESQVLLCRSSENMQPAYHYVSGEPLTETAIVVDAAKNGEVCITEEVRKLAQRFIDASPREVIVEAEEVPVTVHVLKHMEEDAEEELNRICDFLPIIRSEWLEKNLIPPAIARKLRQGFKAAHVAEMRFLCVLFIKKQVDTAVSTLEWFAEVQQVMDESRCPIVQLIHDDKGTHLIAAVNLFRSERNPTEIAVQCVRRLIERETGSVIGMACGEVFCGITGSDVACRWDITGPACVRACRLMQHAVSNNLDAVIDESVFTVINDVSQLQRLPHAIPLKGSPRPVRAYVLSRTTMEVTAGILRTSWSSPTLHFNQRETLHKKLLGTPIQRGVVLLSGPIGCGKKTSLLLSLGQANFVSVAHFTSNDSRPLSVLHTLADWFASYDDEELAALGRSMKEGQSTLKLTKTLSALHNVVKLVIKKGIRFCYVILYASLMDAASLGMIKSVIASAPTEGEGRFLFALTAYPLYRTRSPHEIAGELERQLKENARLVNRCQESCRGKLQQEMIHIEFKYSTSVQEFIEAFAGAAFFHLRNRAAEILLEATGGCLFLMKPILDYVRTVSFSLHEANAESRPDLMPSFTDGTIHVTAKGEDFFMREINWPKVAPAATARFTELYDVLPPRLQLILRVIASLSTTTGSANPYHVAKIMQKLNAKVTEEIILNDVRELVDLRILNDVDTDGGEVRFAVPAMLDVIGGLLTPDQDRLLKRQAFKLVEEYTATAIAQLDNNDDWPVEHQPVVLSFAARLARAAGDVKKYREYLALSWEQCCKAVDLGKTEVPLERMEDRLAAERRRYPDLCTPELFKNAPRMPLLEAFTPKAVAEVVEKRPMTLLMRFFATDFLPPMALGALSGEYQKMGWAAIVNYLDFTKDKDRVFLPDEFRQYLKVDLDLYMAAVQRFNDGVPETPQESPTSSGVEDLMEHSLGSSSSTGSKLSLSDVATLDVFDIVLPLSLAEERSVLEKATATPASERQCEEQMTILFHYYYKVLLPRRERVLRYMRTLKRFDSVKCDALRNATDIFPKTFRRFLMESSDVDCKDDLTPAVRSSCQDSIVHRALLDLATAGWETRYFHVNLQVIREQIFKRRVATPDDFKAFLFCMKLMGESISNGEKLI